MRQVNSKEENICEISSLVEFLSYRNTKRTLLRKARIPKNQ
jgi:hypothetical protein